MATIVDAMMAMMAMNNACDVLKANANFSAITLLPTVQLDVALQRD
ncbi:MAG TPA: hypothetical protein VEK56_04140 [Vicinamibacterales bacterium]|nr:hypothetical protein [Vicinamibacterales bacterium]